MEAKLRSLEQLSFSSQFYFIAYMALSGNLWLTMGFQVVLQAGVNPFEDIIVLPILLFNQVILILVEKFTLFLRKKFRIWEENQTEDKGKSTESTESEKRKKETETEENEALKTKVEAVAELQLDIVGKKTNILKKKTSIIASKDIKEKEESEGNHKENKEFQASRLNLYYKYRE